MPSQWLRTKNTKKYIATEQASHFMCQPMHHEDY